MRKQYLGLTASKIENNVLVQGATDSALFIIEREKG